MAYLIYNDAAYLWFYLILVAKFLFIFVLCIIMHEIGHAAYFAFALNKKVKIGFSWNGIWNFHWRTGIQEDYDGLSDQEYRQLIWSGILSGLLPILLLAIINPFVFVMIIPYTAGVMSDLKMIFQDVKWDEDGGTK